MSPPRRIRVEKLLPRCWPSRSFFRLPVAAELTAPTSPHPRWPSPPRPLGCRGRPSRPRLPSPLPQPEVFKLGVQGPFSGPSARTGEEFKGAANMAFDAVNWQIGEYKIEPVWIDDQSDPAKTSQAYEQAIVQDKIQAGILNWHSSDAVRRWTSRPSTRSRTSSALAPPSWSTRSTLRPDEVQLLVRQDLAVPVEAEHRLRAALEDAIKRHLQAREKTVAIWGEDTDWGRCFGNAIKKQFQETGWKIVAEDYFAVDQTEFYPLLNKMKDLNPALIAGTSAAAPAISALIKQANEVGLKSMIIADGLGWVGDWYDLTGVSSNYVLDQIPQLGDSVRPRSAPPTSRSASGSSPALGRRPGL